MAVSSAYRLELAQPAAPATGAQPWTEPWLRRMAARLQRRVVAEPGGDDRRVVEEIVRLGMRPDVQVALRGRLDRQEAVRDLATRYAFEALIVQGRAFGELDALSRALIERAIAMLHERARQVEARTGEDPLEEDAGLFLSICESLSRYVPRKPMGAHISWKLQHYESAAVRAMRQIEHLVKLPEVTGPFVTFVLDTPVPELLKAQLLQLARGGGRTGVHCASVIRFFALPETVEFVKRFASTVQTARTLYAEEEYEGLAWQGRRRLPANRRQGYLEVALNCCERQEDVSLDSPRDTPLGEEDADWYEVLPEGDAGDDPGWAGANALHKESFEVWVTRHALEACPHDPLWQAGALLFIQRLAPAAIVAQGLATAETLAAVQERLEALRADPEIWHAWMATRLD